MKIDFNTILFKYWLKEGWRISDTSNVVLLELHIKFLAISEIQQIKSSNKRFSLIASYSELSSCCYFLSG